MTTGDLTRLLNPEDYVWLRELLALQVPPSLLAELDQRYERSAKEEQLRRSDDLVRELRAAVWEVRGPYPASWQEAEAGRATLKDNEQLQWGRIFGGGLAEAARRLEPTRLHYETSFGLDPSDLTERGQVKRERQAATAAEDSARSARESAEHARAAARAGRWRWWVTTFISVIALAVGVVNMLRAEWRSETKATSQPTTSGGAKARAPLGRK